MKMPSLFVYTPSDQVTRVDLLRRYVAMKFSWFLSMQKNVGSNFVCKILASSHRAGSEIRPLPLPRWGLRHNIGDSKILRLLRGLLRALSNPVGSQKLAIYTSVRRV